jgi:hypothetical protein
MSRARVSLRDFKLQQKAKLKQSQEAGESQAENDVFVVRDSNAVSTRNRPPINDPDKYVTLIDASGKEYIVPEPILLASQVDYIRDESFCRLIHMSQRMFFIVSRHFVDCGRAAIDSLSMSSAF